MKKSLLPVFRHKLLMVLLSVGLLAIPNLANAQPTMESLTRGLVAIKSGSGVFLSWRLLGDELYETGFNIYRDSIKITDTPIYDKTNYVDANGTIHSMYYVTSVLNDVEQEASLSAKVWPSAIRSIILDRPEPESDIYSPNDASVGDLDSDGEYEIVLKWNPTNAKDNSQSGVTSNVYIDAYELDGTKLWRIDLGPNIRAGAHYTQFMVYDFNLDGRSELVCRTAPGTRDASGNYLKKGPAANDDDSQIYRNGSGYILSGPEYLTLFDGYTGEEVSTIPFQPERGSLSSWGDTYGNRVDRFLAAVAYLDGTHPSVIMSRGYYEKTGIAAYDFDGNSLSQRWIFWADNLTGQNPEYEGQGNHQLAIADVDRDGYDEIMFGSMAIDNDGAPLYNTDLGHGDAYHVTDLDPEKPGLEVFAIHEDVNKPYGVSFRSAETGEVYWGYDADYDVGRGLAADIDPNYPGYECWASGFPVYDSKGNVITDKHPESTSGSGSVNHIVWWDGDLLSEILDRGVLNKYNYNSGSTMRIWTLSDEGATTNNTTKSNPCLTADLFGDWREEIIMRHASNNALLIFNTTFTTEHKLYTLMSDPVYRCAVAWQNVAYNQPPHTGYYLGHGMDTPVKPNIQIAERQKMPDRYSLTVSKQGHGTVSLSSGSYVEGELTVTAEPKEGWSFESWTGDTTATEIMLVLNLNSDKEIVARFTLDDPDGWNTVEAEDGSMSSGSVDSNHSGFSGTGFANTDNAVGEWLDISLYAAYNAAYEVNIIYANGSSDRPASILVNSIPVVASVSMPATGDWDQWNAIHTTLNLKQGDNIVRLNALTSGGLANIDRIEIKVDPAALGIHDTQLSHTKCYPTQMDQRLNIELIRPAGNSCEISITDLRGAILMKRRIQSTETTHIVDFDVSILNSGVYMVKVNTGTQVFTHKVIKK